MEKYDKKLIDAIIRYVDEYKWGWGVVHRQIRLHCGCHVTVPELQRLYRRFTGKQKRVYE